VGPRYRRRRGAVGGLLAVAALALTACASAHAAAPQPEPAPPAIPEAVAVGCGHGVGPGTSTLTLRVGGRDRFARLHIPRGYGGQTLPLVVNLHGSGSTAAGQETVSGMDGTADAHQFLVAYPQGQRRTGAGFAWNVPGTPAWQAGGPDEAAFVRQLVAMLGERYCVDARRVYAAGFSGGGRMASQLACESGRLFAAVAAVGGLRAPSPCPGEAVPVLGVHGTADAQNPYNGPGQPYWTYSVPEAARRWAVHNGCPGTPTTGPASAGVTRTAYRGCRGGASVELYTLPGKGHLWPAPRAGGFAANEVIWRFFTDHPFPEADRDRPRPRT